MALVERIKNICLKPSAEWPVIAEETTSTRDLLIGYVVPLAAIAPIATFIGNSVIGRSVPFIGSYRVPMFNGLIMAVFSYVMAIVGVFIISLIINALAPTFGGEKNSAQSLKLAIYSFTPGWIAGVLHILTSLSLLALIAGLYGLYLLYLGLPRLMKCPPEKAVGYTVVSALCAIVLTALLSAAGGMVGRAGMMGSGGLSGLPNRGPSAAVQFDKDSPLGKLQEMGKALAENNKKMEMVDSTPAGNARHP